jgi:LemA protein
MTFIIIILILIIIFGILGLVYVINYNKMQYLKTKIEQAEGIIDETLRERYDLLVRANDIVKSVLKDNKDYFKDYINVKNLTNFEMDRNLKKAFNILYKFKDDYKELETNKELKNILNTVKETNEKITATTSYYNKNTNLLNGYVRQFPSNIVAKINKFTIKPFFDGKDMTDDVYNDFKI